MLRSLPSCRGPRNWPAYLVSHGPRVSCQVQLDIVATAELGTCWFKTNKKAGRLKFVSWSPLVMPCFASFHRTCSLTIERLVAVSTELSPEAHSSRKLEMKNPRRTIDNFFPETLVSAKGAQIRPPNFDVLSQHETYDVINYYLTSKRGNPPPFPAQVKLTDFGIARELDHAGAMVETVVGTVRYMSPERLHGEAYGRPADVWGLGLVMIECVSQVRRYGRRQIFIVFRTLQGAMVQKRLELLRWSMSSYRVRVMCRLTR